ncbi:MAG: hypothetical protein ACJ72H_10190, partial [Candidatus Sulfotelmatobacter sp.]
ICSPVEQGFAPLVTRLVVRIKGIARVTSWAIFVNGKIQQRSGQPDVPTLFAANVSLAAGKNVVTVTARDAAGRKYSSTHHYTAFYSAFECSPKGNVCSPGIQVEQPTGFDTEQQFRYQASVRDNPDPVLWMSVYVDGTKVAGSTGPFILTTIHATHGSHRVTAIALDTKGHTYHLSLTFNVS